MADPTSAAPPAAPASPAPIVRPPTPAEIEANKADIAANGFSKTEHAAPTKSMAELLPEKPPMSPDGYAVVGNLRVDGRVYEKFREAMIYEAKNPDNTSIVESLEKGPKITRVDGISKCDNEMQPQANGNAVVKWDPNHMHIASDGAKRSPATRLAHELDHASEWTHNPQRLMLNAATPHAQFANGEEGRVICGTERTTCRLLGEGIRPNHDHGKGDFEVSGVTSTTPILHVERNGTMMALPDGYKQNGKISRADENFVYQEVGRGQVAKYPREEFEGMIGGIEPLRAAIVGQQPMAVTVTNREFGMAAPAQTVAREVSVGR